MLVLSGDQPNTARQELWHTTQRSFDKVDGPRRITDLIAQMKAVTTPEGLRHKVLPGQDRRVMRVVRKVIRGLCHYHDVLTAVPDERVWVDVMKYEVPPAFLQEMHYQHRDPDIVEYRYQVLNEEGMNSAWLITFLKRVTFIGVVSASDAGFD